MTDKKLNEAILRCFEEPDDRHALSDFDTIFRPLVSVALLRLCRHDPSMAEDAYQSAFVKYILIFRDGRDDAKNYANYFLVIAKNLLIDELRRAKRIVNIYGVLSEDDGQVSEDSRLVDKLTILEGMTRLSPRCQYVLESYYLGGMSSAEIARRLNVDVKTIYVILQRCRDRLRRIIKGN